MRRFVVLGLLFFVVSMLWAQKPFTLLDTVQIKEVVSYGELKKYQSGVKIASVSATQIRLLQENSLENVLKRLAPIYIKSDAGGLSTIRFRGTSPNHTSLNFGGINLNSLTLGHSNLSTIPSFLFDDINLQYGSSSAVNGSGSIGGAIYLGLGNHWTNGMNFSFTSTLGSFGEKVAATKFFMGNGKWESVSRIYLLSKKNNFPFNNIYTGDIENKLGVPDIQKGAATQNYGILQELNYRFHAKAYLKSMAWFDNNWREVQPNMQSNYYFTGTQKIDNENIRIWSEYVNQKNAVHFKSGAGFVHDYQIFDNIQEQIIQTNRFIAETEFSTDFSSEVGVKAGAKYKYIVPKVHAYSDSIIDFEEHLDVYFSSFYQISPKLKFTLNLRQTFVSQFNAPFTPSLGGQYLVRTGKYSFVKFTGAWAKSYRVPTLNDRFWGIQGNPDLQPESGNNIEFGAFFDSNNESCKTTIGISTFYMHVNNWIEWRNFGIWKAENVLEVVSKGIEIQANTCFELGEFLSDFGLNYTFNPVEAIETKDETGIINRQLNYVPKNMGTAFFSTSCKNWKISADSQFTGTRFTDDFGNKLPAFFLLNGGIHYLIKSGKHKINVTLSSQNMLNAHYQSQLYYAMPGRSFRLGLKYDLNNIQ